MSRRRNRPKLDQRQVFCRLQLRYLPQEGDGDAHGDDGALLDVGGDELPVLRALSGLLLPQKVPGRQVGVAVALGDGSKETTSANPTEQDVPATSSPAGKQHL